MRFIAVEAFPATGRAAQGLGRVRVCRVSSWELDRWPRHVHILSLQGRCRRSPGRARLHSSPRPAATPPPGSHEGPASHPEGPVRHGEGALLSANLEREHLCPYFWGVRIFLCELLVEVFCLFSH